MLVNDVSLRNLIPAELAKGFGFFHGKPSTAFSPVAVTPDELGPAWRDGKVHLPLLASHQRQAARPAQRRRRHDVRLPARSSRTPPRRGGSAPAPSSAPARSRTRTAAAPASRSSQGGVGYSCLAEVRTVETILEGKPRTPFLKFGDRVRIEMLDADGRSIFGAIEQEVVRYTQLK